MNILEDNKTKSVLTTKSIVAADTDITHITYDEDGDWQFLDNTSFDETDIVLVPLKQILEIDKTLKDLPFIRRKETFARPNKNAKWQKVGR